MIKNYIRNNISYRYKKILLLIFFLILFLSIIGLSYASWVYEYKQSDIDVIKTKCFELEFLNESEGITLEKVVPTSDEEGKQTKGYTFTIKNVCNTNAYYQVNLEELLSEKKLPNEYIRVSLNESNGKNLNTYEETTTTIENTDASHKLTSGGLKPEEEVTYNLKLWLDEDTPAISEVMNASFESKISIVATYKENIENVLEAKVVSLNETYSKDEEELECTVTSQKYNIIEISEDGKIYNTIEPTKEYIYKKSYTEEGTYKVYFKDEMGNSKEVVLETTKLDQTAPTIESEETSVVDGVSLEVTFEDLKSGVKEYQVTESKEEPASWIEIPNARSRSNQKTIEITLNENKIYYVWARDNVGNVGVKEVEITKVDKLAPTLEIRNELTTWGVEDKIHLSATDEYIGIKAYSITKESGKYEWIEIEGSPLTMEKSVEIQENGTYYVSVKDSYEHIATKEIRIEFIDYKAPIIENISGNPTSWTNEDVTLTVNGAKDLETRLHESAYSFDNGVTWQRENTKTYSENTNNIIIKVRDAIGNIYTHEAINITKIDKSTPTITGVSGNPTSWTKENVTLTINGASDAGSDLHAEAYSFDNGGSWQSGNTKTYSENTNNIIIKVRDAIGNVYTHEAINITKIDKTSPTITGVSGNPTSWTNGNVTLTVSGASDTSSGLHETAYSFDNGASWQTGNTKTYSSNTSNIIIKVRDALGNVYTHEAINITKIDKTSPTITGVSGNPTSWTNGNVTLTVSGASDTASGLHATAYSFDNGASWQTGNTKTYSSNTSNIIIKVRDAVGNIYTHQAINITKIDKTSPTITGVSGNPTSWTNGNVTLTVNGASDTASSLHATAYSFDNGASWQTGNTKTYTSNTNNIIIKVRDAVGNIYTHETINITKIDKTTPTVTINGSTKSGVWTSANNTMNATVSPTSIPSGVSYAWYQVPEYKYTSSGFTITEKEESNGSKYWNATYTKTSGTDNSWINMQFPAYQYTAGKTYRIHYKIRVNSVSNMGIEVRHAAVSNDYTADRRAVSFGSVTNGWVEQAVDRTMPSSYTVGSTNYTTLSPRIEIYTGNLALTSGVTSRSINFDFKDFWVEELEPSSKATIANNLAVKLSDTTLSKAISSSANNWYVIEATTGSGIKTTSNKFNTKVDKTAPTISGVSGNPTNWTSGNVTLTVNASDAGSGLHATAYSFDNGGSWQSGNTKTYSSNTSNIIIKVRDAVGNIATASTINITKIDKTKPAKPTLENSNSAWTNGNVVVKASSSDSGSGGLKFYYSYNQTNWLNDWDEVQSTYVKETWSAERNNTVYFKAVDAVGNTSDYATTTIKIDKTAPSQSFSVASSTSGSNGWYKALTVKVSLSDGASGVKSAKYCTTTSSSCTPGTAASISSNAFNVTLGTNGSAQKVCVNTTDNAGNTSSTTCSSSYNVDTSDPTAKISASSSGGTITISASGSSDSGSGIATYYYSKDNSNWSSSSTNTYNFTGYSDGTYTVYLKVTDRSGRTSSTVSTSVVVAYQNVYVSSSGNDSTGNGLSGKPFATLAKAYSRVGSGYNIILLSNLTQTSTASFNTGSKTVTLKSNGSSTYTITRGSSLKSAMISISNRNTLHTNNVVYDGNTVSATQALINVSGSSTLNLNSGVTVKRAINATAYQGGAINSSGSTVNINGATISNNKSNNQGAGVYINGGTVTLNSGNITNNIFDTGNYGAGGGIFVWQGTANIKGGTISGNGNDSNGAGGGVWIGGSSSASTLNMTGGTISNNKAWDGGGIMCGTDTNTVTSVCTISGGTISSNSATWGGGIKVSQAKLVYSNTNVTGNTAMYGGGGITGAASANITINSGTISNNTASNSDSIGGGMQLTESSIATINNIDLYSNTATYGGGIIVQNSATLTFSGGKVRSNTAIENGGGIDVNNATLKLGGGQVYYNVCQKEGNVSGVALCCGGNVLMKSGLNIADYVYRNVVHPQYSDGVPSGTY